MARGWRMVAMVIVFASAACSSSEASSDRLERASSTSSSREPAVTTTAATSTSRVAPSPAPASSTTTTRPHPLRLVVPQRWVPFATVGDVVLHHPSDHVEAIGFHQSAQDGAMSQEPSATAVRWFTMEDRDRDTTPRGAADIVVEPGREIRAPVTGTVIRAGTYTLYCDHVDQFAVISPASHPGWEVKILHIEGLALSVGQHVDAGVTPVAAHAQILPFPSQVEESTGLPPWPHVHVEVIDPTVRDRPTGPGCP